MAKVQLTVGARSLLHGLFAATVDCPAEKSALDKAYAKAAPLVLRAVHAQYPVADMEILAKYKVSAKDDCVRLTLTAGGVNEFCFNKDDAPLRPSGYSCRSHIYAADEKTTKAYEAWVAARDAYKAAFGQKKADYKALIDGSKYLEEIESVWPEATQVRVRLVSNLPATLTEDAIARIRADAKNRRPVAA